jgi:NADH-quinone oxidoreductase subunit K
MSFLNFITFFFFFDFGSFFFSFYNLLTQFLIISSIIYFFGICGIIFNRRNFLITMLFIEVMYVGIFLYFITSSMYLNSPVGQLYALVILITAACESAVGLGILLVLFKNDYSINFKNFTELKG